MDQLVNENIKSLKQHLHEEDESENSKEELFGLRCHPSVEETEDSTNIGLTSVTDELNLHGSINIVQAEPDGPSETTAVVYTHNEGYNQTSVQELDIHKDEQGDIIVIESERRLSTDSSHSEHVRTAEDAAADEDNEGSEGRNLPMKTESQKEEDKAEMEYEVLEDIGEVKIQELEDFTWYAQNSYQSVDLVTYSNSNKELGSQKHQNPTEKIEEVSEQPPNKDSESEVISKSAEAGQSNQQVSGSDEDPTKVSHLYIVSEAESRNTSHSAYPGYVLGSDNDLEGICRLPEAGFDLLSEIQAEITTSQSERDISEVTVRSDITKGEFSGESNFQTDNTMNDLALQSMLMPGHPVDKISALAEENLTSITPDEASGDQYLDKFKDLEIPLNPISSAEDYIDVILDQNYEVSNTSEPQDRDDALSELHSVMPVDHSVMSVDREVLAIMSTMNVGQKDKGMEDVSHFNEENNAGILSKETTAEKHENLEECSSGLHLSELLGPVLESEQIFEEGLYSTTGIVVNETEIDVCDVGLDINNASVEISENKEEDGQAEDKTSVTLDETSSGQLRDQPLDSVKDLEISLDTGSSAEDHIEVIVDQNFKVDNISEPQDGSDLLSDLHSMMSVDHEVLGIMSTSNVCQSDKLMDNVGHSNEDNIAGILLEKHTVEQHENLEHSPHLHLSEELESLIEPKQIFKEEHYSSIEIAVTDLKVGVSDIGLDINKTSENKEEDGPAGEDKSYVCLDETSSGQLRDKSLGSVNKLECPLDTKYSAEDHTEVFLDEKLKVDNISKPLDGSDLLSDLQSVMSVDHSVISMDHDVLGIMSAMNVSQSDKIMENVGHSNEDIAGILSEKFTVEEHENLEYRPHLRLSEELESLIEPIQIFKEEHYSSIEIAVSDSKIEVSDTGLDINNTSVEISENMEQEEGRAQDKSYVTLDETLSGYLRDQSLEETELLLNTGSLAEDRMEVIVRSISEGGGDLLSNMDSTVEVIASTVNVDKSIKGMEDGGRSNDEAIVKHPEEDRPVMCVSEELGSTIELEQTFEDDPYSSIIVTETQVEAVDINNDPRRTESILIKETDPSINAHSDLIPNHTVEEISENKDEAVESQSFEALGDASGRQFRYLEVNEPVISLGAGLLAEDIDINLESISELSQGNKDLLSGIHSVETTDHPAEDISFVSTTGEEDILYTNKACDILDESAVQVDLLPDTVIPEELGFSLEQSHELEENQHNFSSFVSMEESHIGLDIVNASEENVNVLLYDHEPKEMDLLSEVQSVISRDYSVEVTTITSTVKLVASDETSEDIFPMFITTHEKEGSEETTQELCQSHSSEELEKKLHDEQDSPSTTLTIGPEDITGFDIIESSKPTDYFGLLGLKSKLLQSMDPITHEGMEVGGEEWLSNKETLHQNKQVITIHSEESSTLIEPSSHMEMSEDQETPVVDHKGTLMEPNVEEDDVVDNSLLPHNTLDVSAQKSRVQLRRKTSIRRKQGQRQVTSESEPLEPPQPIIRSRPMGVPMFPGKMPKFVMAPATAPAISHPEEEQKEEKPTEEDLLVKPKKGIPRHAGFGIPHPQMMQELQARLKKKKPNE